VFAIHDLIISESDTAIKSLFLSDFQNHVLERSQLTVCVSGGGAEGGLAAETEKTQSQEKLKKRGAYPPSAAPQKIASRWIELVEIDHFIREKQGRDGESILRTGKQASRTKQWRRAQKAQSRAAPWFPVKLI